MFKFPFDTQTCHLQFGNLVHIEQNVNVSINPQLGFVVDFYSESNEFILKSTQTKRISWKVSPQKCQEACFAVKQMRVR